MRKAVLGRVPASGSVDSHARNVTLIYAVDDYFLAIVTILINFSRLFLLYFVAQSSTSLLWLVSSILGDLMCMLFKAS